MTDLPYKTRILFPLRTNVHMFQTPGGYLTLEERVKVAALLYDTVILEGGFYELTVSANGTFDFYHPRQLRKTDGSGISDEEAAQRRVALEALLGKEQLPKFFVGIQPSDSTTAMTPIVGGQMEAVFFAEFQSMSAKFRGDEQTWLEWQDVDFVGMGQYAAITQRETWNDEGLGIGAEIQNSLLRSTLLKALNHDVLLASTLDATLSTDPLHSAMIAQKIDRLDLVPSLQLFALQTYLPSIGSVPWDEIIALRSDSGMIDFRRVIGEIEEEVMTLPLDAPIDEMRDRLQIEWNERMVEAIASNLPTLRQIATGTAESVLLDIVNVPVPFLGTAIGLARDLHELRASRSSWLSVFMRLAKSNGR